MGPKFLGRRCLARDRVIFGRVVLGEAEAWRIILRRYLQVTRYDILGKYGSPDTPGQSRFRISDGLGPT